MSRCRIARGALTPRPCLQISIKSKAWEYLSNSTQQSQHKLWQSFSHVDLQLSFALVVSRKRIHMVLRGRKDINLLPVSSNGNRCRWIYSPNSYQAVHQYSWNTGCAPQHRPWSCFMACSMLRSQEIDMVSSLENTARFIWRPISTISQYMQPLRHTREDIIANSSLRNDNITECTNRMKQGGIIFADCHTNPAADLLLQVSAIATISLSGEK